MHVSQCKLELRWVEPDEITYETTDTALVPFNGDTAESGFSEMPDEPSEAQPQNREPNENDKQAIEKVCRRLTMKWEPIFNFTHRYLYCRCILRRTTPSSLCPEITLLVNSRCPRHNSQKITSADYGDIDYHQDPYFDQFGGYNAFRGMVFAEFPGLYLHTLGRYAFIDPEELGRVTNDLNSAIDRLGHKFLDILDEYKYEVYKDADQGGVSLPSHVIEFMRERESKEKENKMRDIPLHPDLVKDFLECPMMQEVEEIQHGRGSRKPHWTVDNCWWLC
ncbi:hypothetical protein F1880_001520 [Penicillium rolfsii]|nr:hypothetical protein F1880_001520 [Penicillium rolfsii]